MKDKDFNSIKPYTYFIIRISDNKKYHGVRVSNKVSPKNDFAKLYFGSSTDDFCKQFKKNPKLFKYRICWTFSDKKEAGEYEVKVNKKIYKKSDWINKSAFPFIDIDEKVKSNISKAKKGKNVGEENHFYNKKHSKKSKALISKNRKGGTITGCHKISIIFSNITRECKSSTRKKLSKINEGRKFPKEVGEKISKSRIGMKLTEEHKKNIGDGVRGVKNGMYGKKHKNSSKIKMSKSRIGTIPWNKGLTLKKENNLYV